MICTPNVPTSVARPGVGGKSMHFPSRGQHHTASLGALGLVDPPLTGPQKRLADASGPRAVYSVNEPQPPCGVAPDSGPGLFSSKASAGHQARQAPGSQGSLHPACVQGIALARESLQTAPLVWRSPMWFGNAHVSQGRYSHTVPSRGRSGTLTGPQPPQCQSLEAASCQRIC